MATPDKKLFRPEALKRFSSPDNLEQLMPVAETKEWLFIVAAGLLFALFGLWSVFGRVTTVAAGHGIFIRPRHIAQVQSLAAGRILSVAVQPGDRVEAGQLIANIDQTDILKRIEENTRAAAGLEDLDRRESADAKNQVELQSQQDTLERAGLEAQRTTLRKSLADATRLKPVLETRNEANRELVKAGLIGHAAKEISDAESAVLDNDARIYDYTSRLEQIDGQLKQIDTRNAALQRQTLGESGTRRNEIAQLKRSIELDRFQIAHEGSVRSRYSGRVLEVMAAPGQVIGSGGKILTLDLDERTGAAPGTDPSGELISISYFPIKDGKKIQPGMRIQLTPDTVERDQFGGMNATVTSVSPVPITKEGAINIIGNAEVVQSLMPDGPYIEVRARIEKDPETVSGYKWSSSRGPAIRITPGLTHATRVTLESRSPATYLLPILRDASGVY